MGIIVYTPLCVETLERMEMCETQQHEKEFRIPKGYRDWRGITISLEANDIPKGNESNRENPININP